MNTRNATTLPSATKKVPVYPAQSVYDGDLANVSSYVRFDFIGEVTVDILVNFDFKEVVVRPLSAGRHARSERQAHPPASDGGEQPFRGIR